MRRTVITAIFSGALALGVCACGEQSGAESLQPTEAELEDIDRAAESAAEQITPESADAEFQKLKSEIGK